MIAPLGLRLAPEKTRVVHIDEGFDFLGFHIRRMRKRGTNKHYVYTTPSRTSVQKARNRLRERTYRSVSVVAVLPGGSAPGSVPATRRASLKIWLPRRAFG